VAAANLTTRTDDAGDCHRTGRQSAVITMKNASPRSLTGIPKKEE
jgi:hypothetical protein